MSDDNKEKRQIDAGIFMRRPETTVSVEEVAAEGEENETPKPEAAPSGGVTVDAFVKQKAPKAASEKEQEPDAKSASAEREAESEPAPERTAEQKKKKKDRGDGKINVVEVRGATQVFNRGKENEYKLFENFDFTIPDIPGKGQLVSIMGASGCGKTKLVRTICGLETLEAGDIRIYGKPVSECGKFPMVFQRYNNFFWNTVLKNVELPMLIRGVPRDEAEERAVRLLRLVGMEEHAKDYPDRLSGGQKQRAAIAAALACDSQIIVFDEATGALDVKMKREVQNIILKVFYDSELDPTIINITHSIEEAAYVSNKIFVLEPRPCRIYRELDVEYPGEESGRERGEWVFDTPEYAETVRTLTKCMDEVCK